MKQLWLRVVACIAALGLALLSLELRVTSQEDRASAGETHVDVFAVASYRKPEWRVDVETPKKSYIRGESVPVTVRGTYYYGAPVVPP